MFACFKCGKGKNKVSMSRHKKGSSGAGGNWALRAPIHVRIQKPNLHAFRGEKYCTSCLRTVKKPYTAGPDGVAHPADGVAHPADGVAHPADGVARPADGGKPVSV